MTLRASPFAYVPGQSWVHRLSPVPKLAWLAAAVAFAFATYHPVPLLIVAGVGLALAVVSGVGRPALRVMAVLGPLAASIIVIQALAPVGCTGACTTAATVGPLRIGAEGLSRGISLVARILAMEMIAVDVLVTTHPSDLFAGLRRVRVPYAFAFMLAMTMQLVPVLQRELALVLDAQRARGLRASGVGAIVPALLPVFVTGFERIQRLAIGMEARGFGAGIERTSWRSVSFGSFDRALAATGLVAGVTGVAAGLAWWGPSSVPVIAMPPWLAVGVVVAAGAAFATLIGRALVAMARA